MNVRAKFVCRTITSHSWSASVRTYKFDAVCADEVPENQRYHKYTPGGSLDIQVDNPAVNFELGKSYYLDFTPAEA